MKSKPSILFSRKVALAVILVALGVVLAPFTTFPIGPAKINPTQQFINVLSAVLLGPTWAVGNAFVIAVLRNLLGTGTILAFPGGMIGALLAGLLYRWTSKILLAALGEIVGTGLIASWLSSVWIVPVLMKSSAGFLVLFIPFGLSTLTGATLAVFLLNLLKKAQMLHSWLPQETQPHDPS